MLILSLSLSPRTRLQHPAGDADAEADSRGLQSEQGLFLGPQAGVYLEASPYLHCAHVVPAALWGQRCALQLEGYLCGKGERAVVSVFFDFLFIFFIFFFCYIYIYILLILSRSTFFLSSSLSLSDRCLFSFIYLFIYLFFFSL